MHTTTSNDNRMARDDFKHSPQTPATHSETGMPLPRYGCLIGGWPVLIPQTGSSTVQWARTIHALPHSSPIFPGLIEHDGRLLPVFDLRPLYGSQSTAVADKHRLLVFGQGREAFALLIDGLPTVLSDPQPAAIPESLPEILRHCVLSAVAAEGRQWLEIEPTKLCQHLLRSGNNPSSPQTTSSRNRRP